MYLSNDLYKSHYYTIVCRISLMQKYLDFNYLTEIWNICDFASVIHKQWIKEKYTNHLRQNIYKINICTYYSHRHTRRVTKKKGILGVTKKCILGILDVIDFEKSIVARNKIFFDGHDYKIYIMGHHIHTISWTLYHIDLVYLSYEVYLFHFSCEIVLLRC